MPIATIDCIPNRLESLTGLRTILAGMVVFYHGFVRCDLLPVQLWISQIIGEMGHCGVTGFFVLSGYILAHVYRNRQWSAREFAVNRIARIYPLYLFALIFNLPADWTSSGMSSNGKECAFGLSAILLQSWFPFAHGRFNGPGWTLSVEAFFYALFPLLYFVWKKFPKAFLWLTVGTLIATATLWDSQSFFLSHRFPLMRVWEFMFGIALAAIPLRWKILQSEYLPLALTLACPAIVVALNHFSFPFLKSLAMVLVSGVVIVLIAARDTSAQGRTSILRMRWMVLGGEISYGIYLLHAGVQRYARVAFERVLDASLKELPFHFKILFLSSTSVVTVLLAWTTWKWLELPCREFIRTKLAPHVRPST